MNLTTRRCVFQLNTHQGRPLNPAAQLVKPFNQHQPPVFQIGFKIQFKQVIKPLKAIYVQMKKRPTGTLVFIEQGKSGAGQMLRNAVALANALAKGGFACTEVAIKRDDKWNWA